ncbi:sulfatase [Stieleria sp. TO1_6]|uniref:sulfatase n=1 Tax=Stieleria tagensis TaxID=2956795 RepID=UPI00209BABE4|nr:sulfatase [Stieleria tagensis]MCO8124272.1 sulfatase [Stieleria tagensis]
MRILHLRCWLLPLCLLLVYTGIQLEQETFSGEVTDTSAPSPTRSTSTGELDANQDISGAADPLRRPDVLMLVVDDMNDWISLFDQRSPIRTPNLERLARRGVLFTQAYCASPACNPSRVATLTGLRPTSSGVYGNASDWRRVLPTRLTVMQQFQRAGYSVRGAGKIFHHHLAGAFHDNDSFDDFQPMREQQYPASKLNQAPDYGSRNTDWGAFPEHVKDSIDYHTASYCIDVLRQPPSDAPLFLACGIFKPHSPFFAPLEFHDRYRDLPLPILNNDDWRDLPSGATKLMKKTKWFWNGMQKVESEHPGSYHDFIRSYAACVSFADDQIGRVLDALDDSPRSKNTIIVLWSDHGFHLGEKQHLEKFALWEKTNHIPLIIVAPQIGQAGARCDRPVDLTTLYPTLLELAGLPADDATDGDSIVPLLRDPTGQWESPAVMTYLPGNHAVRSQHWRYIHYADGTEELYDHRTDPHEWNNLATDKQFHSTIQWHQKWLPTDQAAPAPDMRKPATPAH